LGRSVLTAVDMRYQAIGVLVGRWTFDLVRWEFEAISERWDALVRPLPALSADEEVTWVKE
jgi:hypothetical protein